MVPPKGKAAAAAAATAASSVRDTISKVKRSSSSSPPSARSFPLSLEASMSDPTLQVYRDEQFVCIRDKYPKARLHLLLIPLARPLDGNTKRLMRVEDVIALPRALAFLESMRETAGRILATVPLPGAVTAADVLCGFHAVQTMQPLHMHLISRDLDSVCLKNKKHWNSFTTAYFVRLDELIEHLSALAGADYFAKGADRFDLRNRARLDEHLRRELRCHVCDVAPANLPALKKHLAVHFGA